MGKFFSLYNINPPRPPICKMEKWRMLHFKTTILFLNKFCLIKKHLLILLQQKEKKNSDLLTNTDE